MILPNTPMIRQQLVDLVAAANAAADKGKLKHGPFVLFNPQTPAKYFDMTPPYTVTDRGVYEASKAPYQSGDQVYQNGYLFISVVDDNRKAPLDPATGYPLDPSAWQQPWESCYQRIRNEMGQTATKEVGSNHYPLAQFQLSVSGPWPVPGPDLNYDKLAFYYEDTGKQENVTINGGIFVESIGLPTFQETECFFHLTPGDTNRFAATVVPVLDGSGNEIGDISTAQAGPPNENRIRYVDSVVYTVIVGGSSPLPIDVTFTAIAGMLRGTTFTESGTPNPGGDQLDLQITYDATDPTTLFSIDDSKWMGGAWTKTFDSWQSRAAPGDPEYTSQYGGSVVFSCRVTGVIAPGIYSVKIKFTGNPNNRASGTLTTVQNPDGSETITGDNIWAFDTFGGIGVVLDGRGTASLTIASSQETPAVDDSKRVFKIAVSDFNGLGPPGLIGVVQYTNGGDLDGSPFLSEDDNGNLIVVAGFIGESMVQIPENPPPYAITPAYQKMIEEGGLAIGASTPGLWLGKTPPINNPGLIPYGRMPWNMFPRTLPVAGPAQATIEQYLNQIEQTGYIQPHTGDLSPLGVDPQPSYTFLDAPDWISGAGLSAFETLPCPKRWKAATLYKKGFAIIDSNGNLQKVITEGRSFSKEPAWATETGQNTPEPQFHSGSATQPGPTWTLVKKLRPSPTRKSNTPYPIGATAIDDNGNQVKSVTAWDVNTSYAAGDKLLDGNNNIVTVVTAGTSGFVEPIWPPALGAKTNDGTVVWQVTQLNGPPPVSSGDGVTNWSAGIGGLTGDGSVHWKLIKINPYLVPAVARITPPVYPWFWQNPPSGIKAPPAPVLTDPNLDSFTGKHPFSFQPHGWWIYRVFLNRVPQSKSTAMPPADPIPVTLGCIRNGVFVAFGIYNTGQSVDAFWPVFTNTALAYKAAELVDIQAEILTCGLNYSTWGTITYPMLAAHLNDLNAILPLL